jgi:hypothetical protein
MARRIIENNINIPPLGWLIIIVAAAVLITVMVCVKRYRNVADYCRERVAAYTSKGISTDSDEQKRRMRVLPTIHGWYISYPSAWMDDEAAANFAKDVAKEFGLTNKVVPIRSKRRRYRIRLTRER